MELEKNPYRARVLEARAQRHAEQRAIVAAGKCPLCGGGIIPLTGETDFWRCSRFGPRACNWQVIVPPEAT